MSSLVKHSVLRRPLSGEYFGVLVELPFDRPTADARYTNSPCAFLRRPRLHFPFHPAVRVTRPRRGVPREPVSELVTCTAGVQITPLEAPFNSPQPRRICCGIRLLLRCSTADDATGGWVALRACRVLCRVHHGAVTFAAVECGGEAVRCEKPCSHPQQQPAWPTSIQVGSPAQWRILPKSSRIQCMRNRSGWADVSSGWADVSSPHNREAVCMCSCRAPSNPTYEFVCRVDNSQAAMTFTSILGHLMELDFPASHRAWRSCSPLELFSASVHKSVPQVRFHCRYSSANPS